jgi:hypothetical protein
MEDGNIFIRDDDFAPAHRNLHPVTLHGVEFADSNSPRRHPPRCHRRWQFKRRSLSVLPPHPSPESTVRSLKSQQKRLHNG